MPRMSSSQLQLQATTQKQSTIQKITAKIMLQSLFGISKLGTMVPFFAIACLIMLWSLEVLLASYH